MNATLKCKCGASFAVNLTQAGRNATCPGCGKTSLIPRPKAAPPKAPERANPIPTAAPVADPDDVVFEAELIESEEVLADDVPIVEAELDEAEGDGVKLQEIPVPEVEIEVEEVAANDRSKVSWDESDEDADGAYGLGTEDAATILSSRQGTWCTLGTIPLRQPANSIAYGVVGKWALADQASDVVIVNMKNEKRSGYFDLHREPVSAVALAAIAPVAVSADEDGGVYVWRVPSGERIARLFAHRGAVNSLAVTPDGKFAISGGEDGRVRYWDVAAEKSRRLERSDWGDEWDEAITYVSFSRDGRMILAGGSEGHVAMWEAATGKRVKRYSGVELPISCVRLSDEGGQVTATTEPVCDGSYSYLVISHWESQTAKPIRRLNLAVESIPCCLTPDQGGKRVLIAGGSSYGWMGAWNLENGYLAHGYDGLRGVPRCLAVAPHNTRVLAALHQPALQIFAMAAY